MKRLLILFAGALIMFAVLAAVGELLPTKSVPWLRQAYLKTALVLVSVAAIMADRSRGFGAYGFRRPERPRWLVAIASGLLLGMVATSAVVLTPARGMQVVFEGYRFVDLVVWIWIWSSVSEEIFTRAWFQTLAGQSTDARIVEASSALLFGLMHLSLLAYGVDPLTVLIIVVATTALGFLAARLRTVTRSIYPSITTHVSFNVGSAIAGIVLTILSLATDGAIPRP